MSEQDVPVRPRRLQRIRTELARHNWLSVGIEILIVTLGVLLAFEIEQWGQRRERASQERQFMEQLYADTGSGIAELRPIVAQHEKVLMEVRQALNARGDPAKVAALPKRLDFGCGIAGLPPAPYNDTSYAELVQSGRLALLSDPKLRTAVRDLAAAQAWGASELASSRQQLQINLPPLDNYYDVTIDGQFRPLCRIDWPRLLADHRAVTSTTRAIRRHLQTWRARKQTLLRTEQVKRMLACKLGKPECR